MNGGLLPGRVCGLVGLLTVSRQLKPGDCGGRLMLLVAAGGC